MRAEAKVVHESRSEPALQVLEGERFVGSKARGLLEGSPEAFEPGRGEELANSAEALPEAELRGGPPEDLPAELPTLIGDHVLGRSERARRSLEEPGHGGGSGRVREDLDSERCPGEGSKTAATWNSPF